MSKIHAPTKVNGCIKYEQNLLNIVGSRAVTSQTPVSQCIQKISKCHRILENDIKDPIINQQGSCSYWVNCCIKYEQNLLNTVGCRVVTRAGQMNEQTDERTNSAGHDNTLRPEWAKGKHWQPRVIIMPRLWLRAFSYCPACRTTLIATRFRVAVICPIIQVPHCIRVFFYFVWFVFINHIFQFYYELCTYCNILDIYLS